MNPALSALMAALIWVGEWTEFFATRTVCVLLGHAWSDWSGDPRVLEMRVCERAACRGRAGSVDLR